MPPKKWKASVPMVTRSRAKAKKIAETQSAVPAKRIRKNMRPTPDEVRAKDDALNAGCASSDGGSGKAPAETASEVSLESPDTVVKIAYDTFNILVESTDETILIIPVHAQMTVYELKEIIQAQSNELIKNQKLFYDGNDMKFDDWALSLYGIENVAGVTHRIKLKVFHENLIQTLPLKHIYAAIGEKYLSPKWHVDLRNVTDNGDPRFRGGRVYNRPLGCMRFGIRVLDKHEDSKWLGLKGVERVQRNTHGEWPVAYHGTNEQSVLSILEEGFRLDKGTRFAYGKGIYCTPDPLTALAYAYKSVYQGEQLQLIIQCRVDPAKVQVVAKFGFGEFWLVPSGQEIRPYAVCAYEKLPGPARPLALVQQIQAQPLVSAQSSTYQQQVNVLRSLLTTLQSNVNIYPGASTSNTRIKP